MFVHAYQSLVFNHMTSARIKMHGLKVVLGDLVLLKNDNVEVDDTVEDAISNRRDVKLEVKVVETGQDLADYNIYDVVMTLPGHSVSYPTNEIGALYKEFMARDGCDPHAMKRDHK
jgi:tRNA pseudouridine13 synthase